MRLAHSSGDSSESELSESERGLGGGLHQVPLRAHGRRMGRWMREGCRRAFEGGKRMNRARCVLALGEGVRGSLGECARKGAQRREDMVCCVCGKGSASLEVEVEVEVEVRWTLMSRCVRVRQRGSVLIYTFRRWFERVGSRALGSLRENKEVWLCTRGLLFVSLVGVDSARWLRGNRYEFFSDMGYKVSGQPPKEPIQSAVESLESAVHQISRYR